VISRPKKVFFTLLTVTGFFLLLELSFALVGVTPILYEEDPYVGFSSYIPLFVEETTPNGKTQLKTAANKLDWFNPQRFSKTKARETYRIFCLGGSTTYGRPYDDRTSFCGWLRALVTEADTSQSWEIINAGGISYASYRVALLMEELIRYQPDLFIIYTGHNEFLERRTYSDIIERPAAATGLGALLSRTRLFAVGRKLVASFENEQSSRASDGATELADEVDAVLDRSVGPHDYTRDDTLRAQIVEHFRFNIGRMIDIAEAAGAKVVLINPAANLTDCSPFKSEHASEVNPPAIARWQTLVAEAQEATKRGRTAQALRALEEAIFIDERHADVHFRRGRLLVSLGRAPEARKAFVRAIEEDICALRALPQLQNTLAEIAAERRVPFLDFAALLDKRSPQGLPGDDVFLDHVHPTIEGNLLLARLLFDRLVSEQIVKPASEWGDAALDQVRKRVEAQIDPAAHGRALGNLARVMNWAGKFEAAGRIALRAVELAPADPNAQFGAGFELARQGDLKSAAARFTEVLRLDPSHAQGHYNLGLVYARTQKLRRATEHFTKAVELDPEHALFHNNLGMALLTQEKLQDAAEAFAEAIRLKPTYVRGRINLATALARQGKTEEAVAELETALRIEPDSQEARQRLEKLRR
jgi:tetratricopeptide (TPR) repeat protein